MCISMIISKNVFFSVALNYLSQKLNDWPRPKEKYRSQLNAAI